MRHGGYVTGVRDVVRDVVRERVTIQEAARRLGVSESAIRKRVQRGTLQRHREPDGRLYVFLDVGETEEDTGPDTSGTELVDTLRETVQDLRERLDKEQEANRENRRIIAGLLERLPELDAGPTSPSQEHSGSPETGSAPVQGEEPQEPDRGPQEATSRREPRSWWRRLLERR